jgi:hypothetical protein
MGISVCSIGVGCGCDLWAASHCATTKADSPDGVLNIKGVRQKQRAYLRNALREHGYLDDMAA